MLTLATFVLATTALAQDVFVPPVLKGVKGDGMARHAIQPIPFPAADEQWILARSRHFTFVSSAGERRTREIAANLETLAAALTQLNPHFSDSSPAPTRVFLFSRRSEVQPYFNMLLNRSESNVAGVFVSQKQGGSMVIAAGYGWRSESTPLHELVHNLIANSGAHLPLWIEEGLADYFSNAELRNGSIRAGAPPPQHVEVLRRRNRIPLQQLFAVSRESDAYNLPAGQSVFYAESWTLVNALMRWNANAFYDFLSDVDRGASVETALKARYGRSLGEMERTLEMPATSWRPPFGITLPVPNADTSLTLTTLDRASLLYRLGDFLAGIDDETADAERHFREALAVNPRHARTLAALGRFDDALAADPGDPEIYLNYAESLLGHQIGPLAQTEPTSDDDVARFRQARELLQKALALGVDPGRAHGDLGTTYMVENDADLVPGIAALEKSRMLLPGRMDFALQLFSMLRRTGDQTRADALFTILDRARNAQVAYAARAIIMRVELARADRFVRAQKLDEAAAVIRDLASHTPDGGARADLMHQADDMTRAAETNRQITVYNKAIGEVNRGDYATAMKTLKELLAGATDPSVIRDAKKLQAALDARRKS